MPRRPAAALGVIPAVPTPREPPPPGMPEDEAVLWTRILAGLPPFWIPAGAYPLLEIFVASVINMRACRALMLAEVEGSPRHVQAARLYRDEARTVLRLAKTLRLGPRHDRTKLRAIPNLPKPWDLGRDSAPDGRGFQGWDVPAKPGGDEPTPDSA
jgi:hypothetical protein